MEMSGRLVNLILSLSIHLSESILKMGKDILPGGESNPGLPRDRRGYSPLYYRGCIYDDYDAN